jgi:hypothetical protein
VIWKNRPVKVPPFANVAIMEPETLPEPVQLNFTEFVPDTAEPEPVLIVVAQPTASPTTSSNAALEVIHAILSLQGPTTPPSICRMHVIAPDSDDSYSQTCLAPGDVNPVTMDYS